jgi:pilus assembly protein FimV
LLVLPWATHAAGLGKITVNSSLGQPLSAEIDLLGVQKKELDSLVAKLASPETFKQGNIQYDSTLSGIKFSVEKKPDGQPYLKLTTKQPVNEAFLDFLIELNWSSGRLVKEYTVLLDPPGFTPTETLAPVAVVPEVIPLPAPVEEAKPELAGVPPDEKIGAEAMPEAPQAAAPEAQALEAPEAAAPAPEPEKQLTYGPIKRGETLRKIAESVKPSDYSLEQMLVGLLRSNKSAFMGNNMNRMKTGPILRVPESSELSTIEPKQAVKEVRVQARDWNAYRQRLAEAAGQAAPTEIAKQTASGKIATKIEDQAAPQEPGKEVLKLSKGELPAGKPGGTGNKALQDRIRNLEEEAVAREKAVKEANERIALLEKNIQDMQKLLEIKSQNLAELQKQAGASKAPQPAAQPAPAPKPVETKAPESKPAEAKKTEEKPVAVAAAKPSEAPKPADKTKAPPPPETSLLDDILDNPLYLGGGAGVVILLLGLGYLAVRKKKSLTSFEESVVDDEGLKTSTVFGNTEGGVVVNTGDSSLMSDIASKSRGPVATDDVDPVAEAEVYIAYGRDTQAEEILKEALKKNPTHQNIRLKLLEIYSARKNVTVFDTLARELHAATGGKPGPIWDRVAQLGYALNPGNPMYESAKSATAEPPLEHVAPTPPEMDFNIALPETSGGQLSTDIGMDSNAPAAEKAFSSLDFEVPSLEPAKLTPDLPVESEAPAAGLDFDVGRFPASGGPAVAPSDATMDMISFDFESATPAAASAAAPSSPPQPEAVTFDLSGISLALDEPIAGPTAEEPAKDQHWYEVQTKFDLAKAYQEMGDKEGAREILQEVIQEGDAKQQEQAKVLLAKL